MKIIKNEWVKKFQMYNTLNKMEEADKLVMFGTLLNKRAAWWFENLNKKKIEHGSLSDRDLLKHTLIQMLGSTVNTQPLENRKLQTGKTCTSYINN